MPEGEESMTIQERLELNHDYEQVVAERKARGVAYWRERFAQMPAEPVRKARVFAPEDHPVTPCPSSQHPRYKPPKPLEDLATKSRRKRLTDAERSEKHREEQRRYKARKRAQVKPRLCCECGEPTKRIPRARRCEKCAKQRFMAKKREQGAKHRARAANLPETYMHVELTPSAGQEAR